ncbi:MAG: GNAT family N-acetyltransferase [Patulibacter sp.]
MSDVSVDAAGLVFAPLDPTHRDLLHGWLRADHVQRWWGIEGPVEATASYIDLIRAMDHQRGWIVSDAAGPFAYVETYVVSGDPLADHYAVEPGDRGLHLMVGEVDRMGTPASRALAVSILTGLIAEPGATRVVCEPNVRNERMLRFCASLGAEQRAEFVFGPKTAALLAWDPDTIAANWPDAAADAVRRGRRWDAMDGASR